jgi:hypothetical protein
MKAYGRVGCIDPYFLDIGTSWRSVVSITPLPLYPCGKSPRNLWIEVLVDTRADLDNVEKRKFLLRPRLELRPLCRPSGSYSCDNVKNTIFGDIPPCSLAEVHRRFEGMNCLNFQGLRYFRLFLLEAGFSLGLLLNAEDGGDIFLRNVG